MKTFIVIIRTFDDNDQSIEVSAASEREALAIIDREYEYQQIVGIHEAR